jgi:hypothetical protein
MTSFGIFSSKEKFNALMMVALGACCSCTNAPSRTVGIAAGCQHTCALISDGTVHCWGDNSFGQLGVPDLAAEGPVATTNLTQATQVVAGADYTCALVADGTARCWGDPTFGVLGTADPNQFYSPQPVVGLAGATEAAANLHTTCASDNSGNLWCWGDFGFVTCSGFAQTWPATATLLPDVSHVSVFEATNQDLCVRTDTRVFCRGPAFCDNAGDAGVPASSTAVEVSAWDGAVQLAPGCAVLPDGTVSCFGLNDHGQVGDGTHTPRTSPVRVAGLSGAVGVAPGDQHTCAWLRDGTAWCWGDNTNGQLGSGGPTGYGSDQANPVAVEEMDEVVAMVAGCQFTCAVRRDGSVWCWGHGGGGDGPTPKPVRW